MLSSRLAAVTVRNPPAQPCPIMPAGPTFRPLGNLSRSFRRRSVSAADEAIRHGGPLCYRGFAGSE